MGNGGVSGRYFCGNCEAESEREISKKWERYWLAELERERSILTPLGDNDVRWMCIHVDTIMSMSNKYIYIIVIIFYALPHTVRRRRPK